MFYISYGCTFFKSNAAFRTPWALQALPGLMLFGGMFLLPESPRWLARKNRWEEAKDVLTLVHGKGDCNAPLAVSELNNIKDAEEYARNSPPVSFWGLFQGQMINRTMIAVSIHIWSQLTVSEG